MCSMVVFPASAIETTSSRRTPVFLQSVAISEATSSQISRRISSRCPSSAALMRVMTSAPKTICALELPALDRSLPDASSYRRHTTVVVPTSTETPKPPLRQSGLHCLAMPAVVTSMGRSFWSVTSMCSCTFVWQASRYDTPSSSRTSTRHFLQVPFPPHGASTVAPAPRSASSSVMPLEDSTTRFSPSCRTMISTPSDPFP